MTMPKVSKEMTQEINDSFKTMSVYEKLSHIQNEINVPKNLYNKFGNYYYRNAETIFDTAKPVCMKYRTTLVVSDEVVNVDGRFYIKGIATLCDWDSDKEVTNIAYAREEEAKKGMDASQVTGSCSSYARKYALNGLFNLDDNKDADAPEQKEEMEARAKANVKNAENKKEKAEVMATESQLKMIHELGNEERIEGLKKHYKVNELSELTIDQASQAIKILKAGGNK
nr:MAG TPA: ERF superfamily protein [Caudoviricetes sp.]